jgi:uncharacterized protein with GYD domain
MPQDTDTTTFVSLVTLDEPNVQNVQDLATVWGTIRGELRELDVEVEDSDAVLGEIDFLVLYEAPDVDAAFQADTVVERHGFTVQTMEATATERFADLVADAA